MSSTKVAPEKTRKHSLTILQSLGGKAADLAPEDLFDAVDKDKSGSIEKAEFIRLHGVIAGEARKQMSTELALKAEADEERKAKKTMLKLLFGLLVVILVLACSNLGTAIAAAEAAKESHTDSETAVMTSLNGDVVGTDQALIAASFFSLPSLSLAEMSKLVLIEMAVDLTSTNGGWVQMTTKLASAYKTDDMTAVLTTQSGDRITIMQATQSASIVMGGVTYPASDRVPSDGRRLAAATAGGDVDFFHRRELQEQRGGGGGLLTGGGGCAGATPETGRGGGRELQSRSATGGGGCAGATPVGQRGGRRD